MHIRKYTIIMVFSIAMIATPRAHAYNFTMSSLWNSFKQNRTAHIITGFCAVAFGVYAIHKIVSFYRAKNAKKPEEVREENIKKTLISPENKERVEGLVKTLGLSETERIFGMATAGGQGAQLQERLKRLRNNPEFSGK